MKSLSQFSLPYKGMGIGLHSFQFDIESDFFKHFEDSQIKDGKYTVDLTFDKKADHSVLKFDIKGHTGTTCDRCMADIQLPIQGKYTLHLKFTEDEYGDGTDEIIFLNPETSIIDVSQYVYEYIILSMPMVNTFDCDPAVDCDSKVLAKINIAEEDHEEGESGGIWDSLKDLKLDK